MKIKLRAHIRTKILIYGILCNIILIIISGALLIKVRQVRNTGTPIPRVYQMPSVTPTLIPTISPVPLPTATITPTRQPLKVIFGVGSQAGPAMDFRIVKEAPIRMLTSWYNGPNDLTWMQIQKNDLVPRLYAKKYIVHLVTWSDVPENEIQTPHGTACGRPYPVSTGIIDDMKRLAEIYNGPGPMYVTLFTEFQTYTCTDNNWIGNENYYLTLKDNFRIIKNIFHQYAPNSKVAFSWGGWISRYDDSLHQGGRSLFAHFADVLGESDFSAFQAMESDTNVQEILDMTRILGSYRRPVMLAHYMPHSQSQAVFHSDIEKIFTDEIMSQLVRYGLFAMSFMENGPINNNETDYQLVKKGITKYGRQ